MVASVSRRSPVRGEAVSPSGAAPKIRPKTPLGLPSAPSGKRLLAPILFT